MNDKVCHFHKSLYELRQSPRAWFGNFSQALEKFGIKKNQSNHLVFYHRYMSGIILTIVHDDIVRTDRDTSGILSLKSFLQSQFHTKDLEVLQYFLSIEVVRSKKVIFISQKKCVLDLISKTG